MRANEMRTKQRREREKKKLGIMRQQKKVFFSCVGYDFIMTWKKWLARVSFLQQQRHLVYSAVKMIKFAVIFSGK
jgi:hypothetical protein